MAEEIITSPEESVSMEAPIVESPVDVQEDVVDVEPPSKGLQNLQKLHTLLVDNDVYSKITPERFDDFVEKYRDPIKLKKLHSLLVENDVYSQIMPADINEAADKYGFGGLGKPSAVPSASVSGGSATKGRGVEQPSTLPPTYLSPEELESGERARAVLPSEQTIAVKREDVKQKANMPSAKVIAETTPEMLAEGQQRIIKREAERALFEQKAKQGNFLGMLQNSLVEGFTSTVNNTADFTLYLMSLGGIGVSPEYDAASNQEKARIFSETLDDVGIKKTLDKQLRAASTTPEYTQKRTEEGGPIMEGVVGLAGSAFPMLTPQQSGFFINGFVDSKKEIQEAMPELSPWKQAAYAFTQGAVQVALERAGLSNLAQNKSVTRALSGKVMDAMKTTLGKFTAKEADVFATKVVNGFFAEAETGATQYFVSEGIRQLADALEGDDDKFEFEGGEEFILNIMKSGVSEGVGGVIMKTFSQIPSLIKSPAKKKEAAAINAQTEQLAADIQNPNVSPEAKVAIDKQINDNAEDVAKAYAEDLNKYEALPEESKADLNRINEDIISHEAVLNDPNVSPETKAISEQRIQELEAQGEGILDSAPATKPPAPVSETPTEQAPQTLPEGANVIATLREMEQAEYADIDPNDEAKRKQIYDRYDEIITPLLEKEKELKAEETQAPVAEQAKPQEKGEFSIQGTFDGLKQVLGDPANMIPDIVRADIEPKFSESNQNGKKVFTLTVPQPDDAGRAGYLAVSLVLPETTTKTIDDVKSALEEKVAEAKAAVKLSREKGFPLETIFKNRVSGEYTEQVTPTAEPQAPVAEQAKGESGVEGDVVNKDYLVNHIFIEKINPDGENTALTERQEGSIEKAVQMAIDEGQTAEQIAGTLNALGYAFRNPLGMQAAQQTLINYIENRINGTDTRNINEFARDTKNELSEQAPQSFPAQEGAESVEDKFQANAELEQIYRDLNAAVTKKLDPKTLEDVKRNPTLVMVEKALRELERKGVIKIDCN